MTHAARPQLPRRLGILIVALSTNIPTEHNLADLDPVLLHVHRHALGLLGPDDARRQAGHESMALPRHLSVLLLRGQGLPRRHVVALGNWAVRFRQAVHVHRVQVQRGHGLEQVGGRRGCRDGDADGLRQRLGLRRRAQQRVDRRRRVEVRDALLLQQPPDGRVVDLAQAVVRPAHRRDGPGERPSRRVEHGQRPQVLAPPGVVVQPAFDDVGERGEVRPAMRALDALGPRRRATGVGEREHVFLVLGLRREPRPAVVAGCLVVA